MNGVIYHSNMDAVSNEVKTFPTANNENNISDHTLERPWIGLSI